MSAKGRQTAGSCSRTNDASCRGKVFATGPEMQSDALRCLTSMQGAAAQQEAARLTGEVEREQANVKAALQALEGEKARMLAKAAAEKKRLLEKVGGPDTSVLTLVGTCQHAIIRYAETIAS